MRRRMVEHGSLAVLAVNHQLHFIADLHPAFFDAATMGDELRRRMLRVENFDNITTRALNHAPITTLAAGFAIEWGLSAENVDLIAFHGFALAAAASIDRDHGRFTFQAIVSDKTTGRADACRPKCFFAGNSHRKNNVCSTFAATTALFFHQALEAFAINSRAFVSQDVFGHVERKSIGVVETKSDVAR